MSKSIIKKSDNKMMVMVLTIATSAFLLTSAIFTTPTLFANAIMQNQNMMGGMGKQMGNNGFSMKGMNNNNSIPKINGTINLKNNTNNISVGNVTVPFLTAAQSAQGAMANGKIIGGNIGVTQGFLTYNFAISNPTNNTLSKVIVDAGNGKVLYTSPGMSINSTQFAMKGMDGMTNGFGHGGFGHGGFGQWGSDHKQGW